MGIFNRSRSGRASVSVNIELMTLEKRITLNKAWSSIKHHGTGRKGRTSFTRDIFLVLSLHGIFLTTTSWTENFTLEAISPLCLGEENVYMKCSRFLSLSFLTKKLWKSRILVEIYLFFSLRYFGDEKHWDLKRRPSRTKKWHRKCLSNWKSEL